MYLSGVNTGGVGHVAKIYVGLFLFVKFILTQSEMLDSRSTIKPDPP
jgi:hypothetical protein